MTGRGFGSQGRPTGKFMEAGDLANLAAHAAQDAGNGFEQPLRGNPVGHRKAHPGDHLLREPLGELSAAWNVDVDGASKEVVDDVQVVGREARHRVGRQIDGVRAGLRGGWGWSKRAGGDGPRGGAAPERRFGSALVYDQGAGGQIAEALIAPVAEHGDNADGIAAGQGVDRSEQIAGHRFEEGDGAAGVTDDAELAEPLAWGLAVPEGLKEREVAPVKQKVNQNDAGDEPFFADPLHEDSADLVGGSDDEEIEQHQNDVSEDLQHRVCQEREEAAAHAGKWQADGDPLRSVDAKLVGSFGHRGTHRPGLGCGFGMISNRWIEERQRLWQRLEALLVQTESSGLKSLSGDEVREFGLLYRQAAQDLSAVRADRGSRTQEEYLNVLLARAHHRVYAGRRLEPRQVVRFFAVEYPRLFRRLFRYVAAAVMIFAVGAALGVLLTFSRPAFMRMFLGPGMLASIEHHQMWTQSILSIKPQASSFIMTNNIGVAFSTFAGGIFAGLGTVYELFFNGLQMGVIATACAQERMALSLWSFVAAHGALELPSIFIAGGAGLRLAAGMLFPGIHARRDALKRAAVEAIRLVAGTVPLLVIAGTLEAFLSPSGAPVAVKFLTGAVLLLGLGFWLSFEPGEKPAPHPEAPTATLAPSLPDTH